MYAITRIFLRNTVPRPKHIYSVQTMQDSLALVWQFELDLRRMDVECSRCHALHWMDEKTRRHGLNAGLEELDLDKLIGEKSASSARFNEYLRRLEPINE